MTLVISHSEYKSLKNKETGHPIRLDTRYTDNGVLKILASNAGGRIDTWYDKTVNWGENTEVKQCLACGSYHSKHSPPQCFSCATGQT